jgi:hypothetical protein
MPHGVACLPLKRLGKLGTLTFNTKLTRLLYCLSERSNEHHLRYTVMSEQAETTVQEPFDKSKSSTIRKLPSPVLEALL